MSHHALRAAAVRTASKGGALLIAVALLASSPARNAATARTPLGERPPHRPMRADAAPSLIRAASEYGRISLSVDGMGTTADSGTVQVDKPAGATVRRAFLMAATAGFTSHRLAAGNVTLLGSAVAWSNAVPSNIDSWNYWADVTAIVKAHIDAAPAGIVELPISEVDSSRIDGEALAVIFDDQNQATERSVLLFFGAQNVYGDRFDIELGEPISTSLPGFTVRYGLGISYGYIAPDVYPKQYSVVDVNGRRLTSAAGGQDDGGDANGSLFTVGGVGDSPDDPADPDALPDDARSDDELYDLRPFVRDGDTSITIETLNPSGDDNIFFASLEISGRSVVAVDVDISLHANPAPDAARTAYEEIIGYFADGLYESSDGARKLGRVTIHTDGADRANADIVWTPRCRPRASVSGYGITGLHIDMCDVFADGAGAGADYDFLASAQARKGAGYTLAHEWGHYYFSLYDEYVGDASYDATPPFPHSTDQPVTNSIMNSQWEALNGAHHWLNFSIPKNDARQTAQFRVYAAAGWPTLARPLSDDPRSAMLTARPARLYHPDLADVAPQGDADAALDLPGDARSALRIEWRTPALDRENASDVRAADGFTVHLHSLSGSNVPYPAPLVLFAFVSRDRFVANLGVSAAIVGPDAVAAPLQFRDDGIAPDAVGGDGLYSVVAPYAQNGVHRVHVQFDNDAGNALLVDGASQPSIDTEGNAVPLDPPQPLTATLRLSTSIDVAVSGHASDDHGNVAADATSVTSDGAPTHSRIDYAADVDVFSFTMPSSGATFVRVTNLALGARPRLRVLAADGVSVVTQAALAQSAGEYVALELSGVAPGARLYAAVSDASSNGSGGLYEFSVGRRIASDVAADTPRLLVPFVRR